MHFENDRLLFYALPFCCKSKQVLNESLHSEVQKQVNFANDQDDYYSLIMNAFINEEKERLHLDSNE